MPIIVPFHFMQEWPTRFTTAQIKLLISLMWFFAYSLSFLIARALREGNREEYKSKLSTYFDCESTGTSPGEKCDRRDFENADLTWLLIIPLGLLIGYPIVNIIYVLNLKDIWKWCKKNIAGLSN